MKYRVTITKKEVQETMYCSVTGNKQAHTWDNGVEDGSNKNEEQDNKGMIRDSMK